MPIDSSNGIESAVYTDHQPVGQDSTDKGSQPETEATPFSLEKPFRVGWYVDGFNLYHAVDALDEPALKWLSLRSLAESYLRPNQVIERITFSTAFNTWDGAKRKRHIAYVAALEATGVEVLPANFTKVQRKCVAQGRNCGFWEEKQSDVNLAVEAITDALTGRVNTFFFLTADSDQIPTVKAIKKQVPGSRVYVVAPPDRLTHARDLGGQADAVFELTAGRLRNHPLDREYRTARGRLIATRPSAYGPQA